MADSAKVKFLYTLSFMDIFAFSLFMPLLFGYLRSLQVTHFTIGLLGSVHSGLQLVSGPIIGSWSDIRGHSSILQILLAVCAISYFILGSTTYFPIILLCRIIHGTCEHIQTLTGTLIAGVVPSDKQSDVQGRVASIGGIAFMVGPIIGGHLVEYNNGFQYVCYIVCCVFIINFVNVKFFLSDVTRSRTNNTRKKKTTSINKQNKKSSNQNKKEKSKSDIFRAVTDLKNINWPLYWDIFAFKLFCDFTVGLHYQNLQIFLKEYYDVSPSKVGYILSLVGIMGAVTGFLNGWISKLYKNNRNHAHKAFHCCTAFAFSFVLLGIAPNLTFFIISLMLQNAAGSLINITINEIILSRTNPEQRGSILGTAQSIFSLSFLLAPISSGIVYELYSFNGISILKVLTSGTALIFSLFLFKDKVNDKEKKS